MSRSLSTSVPVPGEHLSSVASLHHRLFQSTPFDQVKFTAEVNSQDHIISVPRRRTNVRSLNACAVSDQ